MRFVLLGANLSILVLLGVYLLDLFSIRSASVSSLGMLFVAAIAGLVVVEEYARKYEIKNFLAFLVPGLAAVGVAVVYGNTLVPVAFILGVVLTIPGLVMLLQSLLKSKKDEPVQTQQ